MTSLSLPVLSPEGGLQRYLQQIRAFPMLSADEEFMLAKRLQEHGDLEAAHKLTTSHLRLVAKIAMGYRGYGLPVGDLIAEGNIGMMQAVKRFDPDRGFRLATYAMWWIKAAIQEYILRSWSLVKMGTGAAHKRLFFNLRKLKRKIGAFEEGDLTPEHVKQIATSLDVEERDVVDMNRRMTGSDRYLNKTVGKEGEQEWMDLLEDETPSHETQLADLEELNIQRGQLARAMANLSPREQHIIRERRLKDDPTTLEDLSQEYRISRERVRQIESRAMEKLQQEMTGVQGN